MIRFVRAMRTALFGVPHRHRWEIFKETDVYASWVDSDKPIYRVYTQRCSSCGEMKTFKVQ